MATIQWVKSLKDGAPVIVKRYRPYNDVLVCAVSRDGKKLYLESVEPSLDVGERFEFANNGLRCLTRRVACSIHLFSGKATELLTQCRTNLSEIDRLRERIHCLQRETETLRKEAFRQAE